MKRFAIFLNASFFFAYCQFAVATDSITYKIESEFAKFYIPIEIEDSYRRFRPETPNGSLEYAIALDLGSSQLGHYLYKHPGASEKETSLFDLVARGQKSVWIRENGSETVSDQHSVDVYYSQPHIVISITNPNTLKLLDELNVATVFIRGFKTTATTLTIKIENKQF